MNAIFKRAASLAQLRVYQAIIGGRLPSLKRERVLCVVCKKARATQYDHRDYAKPLKVRPVCGGCNKRSGPAVISKELPPVMIKARGPVQTETLTIRCYATEKRIMRKAAKTLKISLSEYIRSTLVARAKRIK